MNPSKASTQTKAKVAIFVGIGLLVSSGTTIYVSHHPYWWRKCQSADIDINDGTGVVMKSRVRSRGVLIGYIQDVLFKENYITLRLCISAPVKILPTTRAYVREESFIGWKSVDLKPVEWIGKRQD